MMTYKISKNVELVGTPETIVQTLLAKHREHLYRKNVIEIVDHENQSHLLYYKSKTHYCSECGKVHGSAIQLVPAVCADFRDFFRECTCSDCSAGRLPAPKDWDKEFVEDGCEQVAAP